MLETNRLDGIEHRSYCSDWEGRTNTRPLTSWNNEVI